MRLPVRAHLQSAIQLSFMPETIYRLSHITWTCCCGVFAFVFSVVFSFTVPAGSAEISIVQAIESVRPAVVNIHGHKTVNDRVNQYGSADGPRRVNGMGTGIVIDHRGYILTNHHVVFGVRRIQVTLADGEQFNARLIAHDPQTDLAIIKIQPRRKLPLIKFGSSHDLRLAQDVLAIGNAYGYGHTVTRGIISALNRDVQVTDAQQYQDLIQTDASINPGNSGGPLLNPKGEMIGINVAVRVGAQGIGFAIPVDKAMDIAARLLDAQRIGNVWHGMVENVTSRSPNKYVLAEVRPGSPAETSGLKPRDVLVAVEDTAIRRSLDIERALLGKKPGDEVTVKIRRDDRPIQIAMTLTSAGKTVGVRQDQAWHTLGVELSPIPQNQFVRLGLRYAGGLKVTDVRSGGPAARQGIRVGDMLVGMDKWGTGSLNDVQYVLNEVKVDKRDTVKFYIVRGKETLYGFMPVTTMR